MSEYSEHNQRRIRVYRAAFQLAQEVVESRENRAQQRLLNDMEDLEKTYHYAQRFIPYFMPAVPGTSPSKEVRDKRLAAMTLAFQVVYKIVDGGGVEGLGYNGTKLKYILHRKGTLYNEKPWRDKYGVSQNFTWVEDPWMMVHVIEKVAGGIRRVKAKTEAEVHAKLFMKEEPSGN